MEQMLSADHLEILTWIVERDMGDYACPDAKFVSPALVHNLTEAARLEGELGSEAYQALHPDAEDLALKSWVVMMIFLKRCSLVGFPIYADLHWTLLGQRVLCAHPQLHTQRAHIGTLASDIVSTLSQTYRCKYAYIYGWMDSPFNHSSGHGSSFGSGLPVCAIHAGHVLLPGRSPAQ